MEKIKLEILGLTSSQSQSGSFALVLGEVGGKRRMPIIIGMFEAQAIAIEIEKIQPNRPMTHDLFRSISLEFPFHVDEIVIWDLKEGVFFAQMVLSNGEKVATIDARPSDAIAIGLRFGAPIYTFDKILNEAGINVTDEEEEEEEEESDDLTEAEDAGKGGDVNIPDLHSTPEQPASREKPGQLRKYTVDKLNEMLKQAIEDEDYERAARIRDELGRRN